MDPDPVAEGRAPTGTRPMILLIEDDADLASMSGAYLERDGFQVTIAPDVRSGMSTVNKVATDLLVLDVGLPDGSGLDLLRGIRQGPHRDLPVIIVTGRGEET